MVRDNNNPDDDDNVSCPFVIRKDRIPPDNRKRSTVPILRYGDLYYCFADLVIGPVLPTVYLTLPSFAYASHGEPYVCERKRTGTYPKGGGWENGAGRDIVPIGPVPICYRDVMGDTVTTYEQWVDDYRGLPGVPFYSSTRRPTVPATAATKRRATTSTAVKRTSMRCSISKKRCARTRTQSAHSIR
ncbi:hypothetical protein [Bifidobacterium criceti]|uniref:hypothetical protein n=1 Tax=Bifidobacterium criceti TaxID=1960969 RepID=UPI0013906581|nr:hypothetical protein [Bifidobacterium criceti]